MYIYCIYQYKYICPYVYTFNRVYISMYVNVCVLYILQVYMYIHINKSIFSISIVPSLLRSSPSTESIKNESANEYPLGEKGTLMKKKIDR
jgi:hypothetical protein